MESTADKTMNKKRKMFEKFKKENDEGEDEGLKAIREHEDCTDEKVFKISCEYFIKANSKEEVIDFIANENNLVESHFIINEVNKEDVDEDDIYNREVNREVK